MTLYHQLSPKEKYIYSILLEVKHDSTYGEVCDRLRNDPTPERLRSVIDILTKAALVDPGAMSIVIGWELVDILLASQGVAPLSA